MKRDKAGAAKGELPTITAPRIAVVLPRNMHFGPAEATSIDLCVRDMVAASRYRAGVTVICQAQGQPFEGFDIRPYPGGSTRARVRAISALLHEIAPDLIVVHQHVPTAQALARRHRRVPVLIHRHNFERPRRGLSRWLHERRYDRLAGVLFVSEACAAAFRRDYPRVALPVLAVPNALDAAEWPPGPTKEQTVVHIGRQTALKGSLEVARALCSVLPAYPGWRGRLIGPLSGDTAYDAALREAVAGCEAITLEGAQPFAAVRKATRAADIAIVASAQEAFGRVAIEAFAAEAALVSTTAGGLAEVVEGCALTIDRAEPAPIADALRRLLDDDAHRRRLAIAGRRRFEERYTIDRVAARMDAIYAAVIAGDAGQLRA